MKKDFYSSKAYKEKQSVLMKESWKEGFFDFHYRQEERVCKRKDCVRKFGVKQSSQKQYCGSSCAAKVNNVRRGPRPGEVKVKISEAMRGHPNPYKGKEKVPRVRQICLNTACEKVFRVERHRIRKFCSNTCAMRIIGGNPTSPKAVRGKAGIRKDISDTLYFYSRWEANMARIYTYLGMRWIFQPKALDLGGHMYTPDFYLPEEDTYIEVKNFLGDYSKERDRKFRAIYPNLILRLIGKDEYYALEKKYGQVISGWEYKNDKRKVLTKK